MEKFIQHQLMNIEKSYNVKVLLAIEAGSRALGLASKESDYDVRFIYIHSLEWYLSIDSQGVGKRRDVIELPISNELDMSGWELTKALRLFRKSNPTIFEWLRSQPVYYQQHDIISKLKLLESEFYNPKALLFHYINIAKNNIQQQHGDVQLKGYLYALRSVFCCKWIEMYNEVPPITFQNLMEKMELDEQLTVEIEDLIEKKTSGYKLILKPIPIIEEFIRSEIFRLDQFAKSLHIDMKHPTEKLDNLFREMLKKVW